jgi:hypothetical protein
LSLKEVKPKFKTFKNLLHLENFPYLFKEDLGESSRILTPLSRCVPKWGEGEPDGSPSHALGEGFKVRVANVTCSQNTCMRSDILMF